LLLQHAREERLDHSMHRFHVEIEGEVPILLGAVEHAAMMHVAGAVDEHVECAELGCGLLRERLDRRGRAYVEFAALYALDSLELFLSQTGGDHAGTLGRKCIGDGTADPLSRRGDERELALQT